jgi:PAS domain S-box-containing protein
MNARAPLRTDEQPASCRRRLRHKILLSVGLASTGIVLVLFIATRTVMLRSFARLEEDQVRTNVKRVEDALSEELAGLDATGGDWGAWNDTRDFILGRNEEFIETNLQDVTLVNLRLDFMLFVRASDELVYAKCVDLEQETSVPVPASLTRYVMTDQDLLHHADVEDSHIGIALLPESPVLIAAWPITMSDMSGPVHGTLILGRYLDEAGVARLAQRTRLDIRLFRTDDPSAPKDVMMAQHALTDAMPVGIQALGPDVVAGYSEIRSMHGEPCLTLRVQVPRTIFKQGTAAARLFLAILALAGTAIITILLISLQRMVLVPIATLSRHVETVGRSKNFSKPLDFQSDDEIGRLIAKFNEMTDRLRQSEERFRALTENSRDTIMRLDRDGRHLYVNPVVETQTGIPPGVFIGKTHAELGFPQALVTLWEEAIQSVFTTKTVKRIDFKLPNDIWIDWLLMPEFDERGEVKAAITAARDITDRKVAEQKVVEQNRFLESVLESLIHPFYVINVDDYTIRAANSAAKARGVKEGGKCYALTHHRDTPCANGGFVCPFCADRLTPVRIGAIFRQVRTPFAGVWRKRSFGVFARVGDFSLGMGGVVSCGR